MHATSKGEGFGEGATAYVPSCRRNVRGGDPMCAIDGKHCLESKYKYIRNAITQLT